MTLFLTFTFMPKELYALQRDLDMIAVQVNNLTNALTTLDWIAQKVKKLEEELTCQGEQMRRMEERMRAIESQLALIIRHLKIQP